MQTKTSTILITGCLAIVLLAGAFAGGIFIGWALPRAETPVPQAQSVLPTNSPTRIVTRGPTSTGEVQITPAPTAAGPAQASTDVQKLFKPFWESWDLVHQQYVNQPVDDTSLMQGAIKGMLDSLGDSHTFYADPKTFQQQMTELTGQQYEGIGAWVDTTGKYLKIIGPMPNSPAEKAGLKAGDIITAVDKQDVTGIPGDLVLKKVLGPADSKVVLTIQRGSADPFDVTLQRAKIVVPQAEWRMEKNNIAYINLFVFGDQTATELHKALQELLPQKPRGLILDLRNNPGGYLDSAIAVLSEFVPEGKIVMYEEYGNGQKVSHKTGPGGLLTDGSLPIIILMNEASASASEITAGALQDLGLAKLVGVKSYGKGSVQIVSTLADNQGGVRITVARWLTPDSRQINGVGLNPDIEVKVTQDDITAGIDPQLAKALDLLSAK